MGYCICYRVSVALTHTTDIEPKFISSVTPQTRRKLEMRRRSRSFPSENMPSYESSRQATPPNQLPSNTITQTQGLEDTRQGSNGPPSEASKVKLGHKDEPGGSVEGSLNMDETGRVCEDTVTSSRLLKGSTQAVLIPDARRSRTKTDMVGDSGALHSGSLPVSILKRMSDATARDQLSYSLEKERDEGGERIGGGGGLEVEEEKPDDDIAVSVKGVKKNPRKKSKKRQKKRKSDGGKSSTSDASRLERTRLLQEDVLESREQISGSATTEQGDERVLEGDLVDNEGDLQLPKSTTEPDALFFSSAGRKGREDGEEREREGGGGRGRKGEGESERSRNINAVSRVVEDGEEGRYEREVDEETPQTSTTGVETKDSRTGLPWSNAAVSTIPTSSDTFSEAREVPFPSVQPMKDSKTLEREEKSFQRPKQIDLGLTDGGDNSRTKEQVPRWTDEQGPPHGTEREGAEASHTRPTLVSPLTGQSSGAASLTV